MSKKPQVSFNLLDNIVKRYPKEFRRIDNKLFCSLCEKFINIDSKHGSSLVNSHIKTSLHLDHKRIKETIDKTKQQSIVVGLDKMKQNSRELNVFSKDLTEALIKSNIPLSKVDESPLIKFLEKHTGQHIPSSRALRSYVDILYESTLNKIRETIKDNDIYFIADETTDRCGRYALNIMVGILSGEKTKSMLLSVKYLSKCDAKTIGQEIIETCRLIWPERIQYHKVLLIVTDQAANMKAAIRGLKEFFFNISHVTCIVHALHLAAEAVRNRCQLLNEFISSMKTVLSKSASRQHSYKEYCKIELPPNPVITRWGTWIETANYYYKNFEIISDFVKFELKSKSESSKVLKELIDNKKLQDELFYVNDFAFLPINIKSLESQGMKKSEQMDVLNETKSKLKDEALAKLNRSLEKSPDIISFVGNNDFSHRKKTLYAPLTSVDVERSFSIYKNILTDRRLNLTTENIEKYNVIEFNKNLFDDSIEID